MSNKILDVAEESARGGFLLFTGNVLSLIVLAVGSIMLARVLGPESFGLFALSLALSSILTHLIDLGVDPALTRFSAKHRAEGKTQLVAGMVKSGLHFKILISLTTSILCFFFSDTIATSILVRPEISPLIKLMSILIVFHSIFLALDSTFIGLDKMEANALILNTLALTKTTLSPLLVILGLSITGALAGHIVGEMIACIVGGLILSKFYKGLVNPSDNRFINNLGMMLHYGFPIYLSSLLTLISLHSQTIILGFFVSNIEIGNFSVAVTLSNMLTVLILPLTVLFPAFSKVNPSSDDLKRIFSLSVKYGALFIVPAAVIITILSQDIVHFLYGDRYSLAPSFLSLYVTAFLYAGAGSVILFHLFNGIGQTKITFKQTLINLLVFLPLSSVLVGFLRVHGLIIAFLISSLLSLGYGLFYAIKEVKVDLDIQASLGIYFASFFSAIPTLLYLSISPFNELSNLLVGGTLFLLAYLTAVPITGALSYSDLENFELIFRKNGFVRPMLKYVLNYEKKIFSLIASLRRSLKVERLDLRS